MALTKYTKDTSIIGQLGTRPEDRPGMTDQQLKDKFDENALNWKEFWNNTASKEIDALIASIKGAGWTNETLKGLADLISNLENALSVIPTGSYLAFCVAANADSLDAAFGKGNDENMLFLGKQLAMYAWFKGDSKATYPFTNLMTCHSFNSIFQNPFAFQELVQNTNLINLINSSPYAKAIYEGYITTETVQLARMFASIGTSTPSSYASFSEVCTNRTLVEAIFTEANTAKINTIVANITGLSDKLANYEYTGVKRTLMLAGLSITSVTTAAEFCDVATLKSRLAAVIAVEAARIFMVKVVSIKNGIHAATSLHQVYSQINDSNKSETWPFNIGNVIILRMWCSRNTANIDISKKAGFLTPSMPLSAGPTGNVNGDSVT